MRRCCWMSMLDKLRRMETTCDGLRLDTNSGLSSETRRNTPPSWRRSTAIIAREHGTEACCDFALFSLGTDLRQGCLGNDSRLILGTPKTSGDGSCAARVRLRASEGGWVRVLLIYSSMQEQARLNWPRSHLRMRRPCSLFAAAAPLRVILDGHD